MKLYELDRGDLFKLAGDDDSPVFKFDHLDGMYSVCYLNSEIIHIAGFAPVIRVSNVKKYKIIFMSGREYPPMYGKDENNALSELWKSYPETYAMDILKIEQVDIDETNI